MLLEMVTSDRGVERIAVPQGLLTLGSECLLTRLRVPSVWVLPLEPDASFAMSSIISGKRKGAMSGSRGACGRDDDRSGQGVEAMPGRNRRPNPDRGTLNSMDKIR